MATYSQLLSELQFEAGQLPDNIPYLIREVEDELWRELYFCAPEQVYTVSLPQGQEVASLPPSYPNFMQIKSLLSPEGKPLWRVSPSQYNRIKLQNSVPELFVFLWKPGSSQISVWSPPAQDSDLLLIAYEREAPIQDGDSESTKFFLGDGYTVLKYAVLYRKIFNPDKWELWKSRFSEAYLSLIAHKTRQRISLLGGSSIVPRYSDQ